MIKRRFRSLFTRFLLSYIIVMLIPAVVLYTLYTKQTVDKVTNEIFTSVQLDQRYAISLLDNQIAALSNAARQFQLTRGFRSYRESHSFYYSPGMETYGEIIEDLFTLSQRNPFTDNFFVYFHDPNCAFSSRGLHQIDTFISSAYRYERYTSDEYIKMLKNAEEPLVFEMQKANIHDVSAYYLTFIFPLYSGFKQPVATAVFCVNEELISSLLSARMDQYNTSTYIYNTDGTQVYWHNPLPGFDIASLNNYMRNYRIVEHTSPQTQWRFITLIPNAQPILNEVFNLGLTFTMYSALTLLLSSLVVWFMMRLNYQPIRELKEKATGITAPPSSTGELETIANALDYLRSQNQQLNTTVLDQSTIVANNELRKLLSGSFSSIEEFNLSSPQHLHYHGSYLFVAVFLFQHENNCTESLASQISHVIEQYCESNYIYHLEPNKLITINCMPEAVEHLITDAFCAALRMLNSKNISATVGVGSIVDNTSSIIQSYMEAQSAIDYRFVKGKDTVILYNDLYKNNDSTPAYPTREFERLKNAVSADDQSLIYECIQALLEYITLNSVPLFLARGICFDIIRVISESTKTPEQEKIAWSATPLQRISSAETAQDLINMVHEMLKTMATKKETLQNTQKRTLARLKGYLEKNCCNCNFSIQEMAAEFHMLPSNLSAFFKAHTGGNLLDYVTDLRIQKAKELLEQTDNTIADISQQVGYYNVSSFVRRFRENQGITPGVFRVSAKKKKQLRSELLKDNIEHRP